MDVRLTSLHLFMLLLAGFLVPGGFGLCEEAGVPREEQLNATRLQIAIQTKDLLAARHCWYQVHHLILTAQTG